MKFSASTLLLLLPSLALSSPAPLDNNLPERNVSPLNDLAERGEIFARDRKCWITSGQSQGCDTTPRSGKRKGTLVPGTSSKNTFGVKCYKDGKKVTGNGRTSTIWLYVPAYKCYVWSGWADYYCGITVPECV
ncbi:hypothetical protein G7Z17_g3947 [Cylindrodendrum hubeiense]|uniref:Uncharacterized protein n=1 Tax=Cylindrodendrum hubeiense TaxID=595255 RepID=A0A9P5HGZ6_9HYPO|nr:hypothetical protein G7Z17_g3947 [Cylindrodendrum hubeiense]